MIGQDTLEVERKIAAILKVLSNSSAPLGGRLISQRLKQQGIELSERTVRYHLKLMDERGLTHCANRRGGRFITEPGLDELRSALVCDKVGFVASRIELLSYLTTVDLEKCDGRVPIDVSLFHKRDFDTTLDMMERIFRANLSISNMICIALEGEVLGDVIVPVNMVGFATVSNIVVNGILLKAGVPITPKFGGLLQRRRGEAIRFVDLIEYEGSTLDPFEIFIAGRMTNVVSASRNGGGKVLASFHEIPVVTKATAESIFGKLEALKLCSSVIVGRSGAEICQIPVRSNHAGLVILSGLNPIAAVAEAGIEVIVLTMHGLVDVTALRSYWSL